MLGVGAGVGVGEVSRTFIPYKMISMMTSAAITIPIIIPVDTPSPSSLALGFWLITVTILFKLLFQKT